MAVETAYLGSRRHSKIDFQSATGIKTTTTIFAVQIHVAVSYCVLADTLRLRDVRERPYVVLGPPTNELHISLQLHRLKLAHSLDTPGGYFTLGVMVTRTCFRWK